MKPTFFDTWPNYIFRRSSKGELLSVLWESEYEQLSRFENRRGRRVNPVGRRWKDGIFSRPNWKGAQMVFQETERRLGIRRKPPRTWTGTDQRNPLRCSVCRRPFPDGIALGRHLPCRENQRQISYGFVDLVTRARNRGVLYAEEVNYFRRVLNGSLSEDAFSLAWTRRNVDFFPRSEDKTENFRQFRVESFLCFLFYVRPLERLNPKAPSRHDWRLSEGIEEKFFCSDERGKAKVIRQLFDRGILLEDIAKRKRAGRPTVLLSPADKEAFVGTVTLHREDAADWLTHMGVKLADGTTPLQLYEESPAKFSDWLRERRRASGIKPRPYRRNSAQLDGKA